MDWKIDEDAKWYVNLVYLVGFVLFLLSFGYTMFWGYYTYYTSP